MLKQENFLVFSDRCLVIAQIKVEPVVIMLSNDTGFAPCRVHPHRVRTSVLILNFHLRVPSSSPSQNIFCVILFHHVHNIVFFLGKRKINFKHLIAS